MDRGWNAIINDNLIANAFSIQIVAVAILNALLGSVVMLLLSSSLHISVSSGALIAGAVLGAILGAVVGSLMVSCLDSAVCMVFVCFAEDPATLQVRPLLNTAVGRMSLICVCTISLCLD